MSLSHRAWAVPRRLTGPDYERVGLRVGLEIHQQLNTSTKLFCGCAVGIVADEALKRAMRVERVLRIARSELGEVDAAAQFEIQRERVFMYAAPHDLSCLVELDEEPPHPINKEALLIALAVAKALRATIVDEVHVMRKIVVDGSNTTGFQRTAIIALGGYVMDEEGPVRIQTIALEEDASRKLSESEKIVEYSLDRLGIPLIEISTAPDMRTPTQARRVAERIGLMLRLTGRVRRGLGTIRQDLNLSIAGSPKIEVKGIQKLELIPKVIEEEVRRLLGLMFLRDELVKRGVTPGELLTQRPEDVTDIVSKSSSKMLLDVIKEGGKVYALRLPKFKGLLALELQTNRRFGTELADYARQWAGVRGLIHSDELPRYGIDENVVKEISAFLGVGEEDAFVIVADKPPRALRALEVVRERAAEAVRGIPRETRGANEDGTTRYLRPQPGAARMYPETDIPPIRITTELLVEAEKYVPPTIEEKMKELVEVYGISTELARQLLYSEYLPLFEEIVKLYPVEPRNVATLFTTLAGELKEEGINVDMLDDSQFHKLAKALSMVKVDKEGLKELVTILYKDPALTPERLVKAFTERRLSEEAIRRLVRSKIEENLDEVLKRGDKAFQYLMGKIMGELRGRVDGRLAASIVQEELSKLLRREGKNSGGGVASQEG